MSLRAGVVVGLGVVALGLAWGAQVVVALHLLWTGPVELGVAAALAVVVQTGILDRLAAGIRAVADGVERRGGSWGEVLGRPVGEVVREGVDALVSAWS